jgi:uncharacterized membrane protein
MTSVGIVHTALGAAALACGLAVVLRPKGTRWHRAVGWAYVASMAGLCATSFLIYRLFGGFGPFHWAAVAGAATLAAGLVPVRWRRRGAWRERHAYLMSYSYLGLLAATVAEIVTRVPGVQFAAGAAVASVAVLGAGAVVISRAGPGMLRAPHSPSAGE